MPWKQFWGTAPFWALVARPLLRVFSASYRYVESEHDNYGVLWDSVLDDLRVCWDLLCYGRSEWCLDWNPLVMCSDASPSGWRLTAKCGDKPVVKRIGRVKERVRFKLMPGVSARDQVLTRSGLLGFVDDLVDGNPPLVEDDWHAICQAKCAQGVSARPGRQCHICTLISRRSSTSESSRRATT